MKRGTPEPKSLRWSEADHYSFREMGHLDSVEWMKGELRLGHGGLDQSGMPVPLQRLTKLLSQGFFLLRPSYILGSGVLNEGYLPFAALLYGY